MILYRLQRDFWLKIDYLCPFLQIIDLDFIDTFENLRFWKFDLHFLQIFICIVYSLTLKLKIGIMMTSFWRTSPEVILLFPVARRVFLPLSDKVTLAPIWIRWYNFVPRLRPFGSYDKLVLTIYIGDRSIEFR